MKPVLLTVDDDPQVLIAIQRDLGRQYGKRFRIVGTDSGKKALELIHNFCLGLLPSYFLIFFASVGFPLILEIENVLKV